jgi:uncharacterized protein (TIGR04222 family)
MNPFQLSGFSFLGFYVLVGVAAIWGLWLWIRQLETANASPTQNMTDPYLIAHLRGGEIEALRVATFSLLDRGLLKADGEQLQRKNGNAVGAVQRPIEKAILKFYAKPGESHKIFKDPEARRACEDYAKTLKAQQMVADAGIYAKRFLPAIVALGLLTAISWTKVNIALSQGRHNVGFLVTLTVVFVIAALVIWFRRRTARGDAMLTDLQSLFARLKNRSEVLRAGGQTNEAALLAAVFGLSALSVSVFPFMERLYPAKSDSSSGCGSSSSCSSGSSCSGGCGGGGCGG